MSFSNAGPNSEVKTEMLACTVTCRIKRRRPNLTSDSEQLCKAGRAQSLFSLGRGTWITLLCWGCTSRAANGNQYSLFINIHETFGQQHESWSTIFPVHLCDDWLWCPACHGNLAKLPSAQTPNPWVPQTESHGVRKRW